MLARISKLPGPLKLVVWINLVGGVIALISGVAEIGSTAGSEVVKGVGSAAISFLIVIGIIQRSRVVRMLVLVLSWLGVVVFGAELVIGLVLGGIAAVMILIPLAISVLTVWGLRAPESKQYFRIGAPDDKRVTRDWMENPIEPTPESKDA